MRLGDSSSKLLITSRAIRCLRQLGRRYAAPMHIHVMIWGSTMKKSILFLFMFVSINSFSAGFDCAKAKEKIELLICSDHDLSDRDEYFSEFYASVNKNLAIDEKDELRRQQIEWLKKSRNICDAKDCVVDSYKKREIEINLWLKNKKPAPLESDALIGSLTDRQESW